MKIFSSPVIVTVAAITCIGLAIAYNGHKISEKNSAPKPKATKSAMPNVSVIHASSNTYKTLISGHGEAKAHWALTLKAQVAGEVTSISKRFETGNIVSKGSSLANIDNTDYLQAISGAKANLAEAQHALQEEKDLSAQAQREWSRSGVTQQPSSPLVFRTLQLAAEKANANDARYSVKTALRNEKNTHISSPFDAVILSRDINMGSYVSVGDTIATLNSTDKVEVFVPLSMTQFTNVKADLSGDVVLTDISTGITWQGYIDRVENHLDASSRQRNIVVAVDKPLEQKIPLLAGTFLLVEIAGKTLDKVLKIPSSAVAQDGQVWYVDANNTLVSVFANKIFERGDFVYITPIHDLAITKIVTRPLVSYLNGMLVNPMLIDLATEE